MAAEAAETLTNELLDAVKFGNAEAVRRLLEAGADEAQMKISLATIFIDKFPVGLPIAPLRTIVEFWAHAGDY